MKRTKQYVSYLLCIVYLLASSIIFHTQAMDILRVMPSNEHCGAQQHTTHDAPQDNCFDKCLWNYDDYNNSNIAISESKQLFCLSYVQTHAPVYTPDESTSTILELATSPPPWPHFSQQYVGITLFLE